MTLVGNADHVKREIAVEINLRYKPACEEAKYKAVIRFLIFPGYSYPTLFI